MPCSQVIGGEEVKGGGEGVRDEEVRSEGFIWEPLRNYTT